MENDEGNLNEHSEDDLSGEQITHAAAVSDASKKRKTESSELKSYLKSAQQAMQSSAEEDVSSIMIKHISAFGNVLSVILLRLPPLLLAANRLNDVLALRGNSDCTPRLRPRRIFPHRAIQS